MSFDMPKLLAYVELSNRCLSYNRSLPQSSIGFTSLRQKGLHVFTLTHSSILPPNPEGRLWYLLTWQCPNLQSKDEDHLHFNISKNHELFIPLLSFLTMIEFSFERVLIKSKSVTVNNIILMFCSLAFFHNVME